MTKKEELQEELSKDLVELIEDVIKIRDKEGNLVDFKLSRMQKLILKSIITKNIQAFHIRKEKI